MINEESVDQVRRFERLYENYMRKARRTVATEDFNVVDSRVLHEMGFVEGGVSGAWLAGHLDLDASYLCRVLKKLEAHGLMRANESGSDGRMRDWELTDRGRDFAASIEKEYRERARWGLIDLTPGEERVLVGALALAERLLLRVATSFRIS